MQVRYSNREVSQYGVRPTQGHCPTPPCPNQSIDCDRHQERRVPDSSRVRVSLAAERIASSGERRPVREALR